MGTLEVKGVGGTLQLYAWGNYSSGKTALLDNRNVTWNIVLTPGASAWTGVMGDPNAAPPQTIQLTQNGLMTAVTPFACSFVNVAIAPATTPSWALQGTYTITTTYQGMTSSPAYVAVASDAGIASSTNPTGACGP